MTFKILAFDSFFALIASAVAINIQRFHEAIFFFGLFLFLKAAAFSEKK